MFEKVQAFFAEKVECKKRDIKMDTELTALGVDSLKLLMIINEFEEEFGVTISDKQLEELHTISDVVALVEKK